jgi:hypothetical protein
MGYVNSVCDVGGDCGRKVAVEISGQASIVDDQGASGAPDPDWHTCTIPDSFSISDPADPSGRTIKITADPLSAPGNQGYDWDDGEAIWVDWYQLSTYKVFPDCP